MTSPVSPLFRLLGLGALLCSAAFSAQALGRLADLTIVDRSSGATLPVYYHHGEYWVAGQPGARYSIAIRNQGEDRLLAVTSVDGVNVLTGASAGVMQSGYVFDSYSGYQISGWRKSDNEVAAFEFAAAADSYAERTGRPQQVGVIGVALFRERRAQPLPSTAPAYPQPERREQGGASESRAGKSDMADLSSAPALAAKAPSGGAPVPSENAPQKSRQQLGTGHGQIETSPIAHTSFERAQSQPNEIIRIRYDSRESLIAMGIISEQPRPPVNPFPASGYVPDPPARRF
jgi:hypothetical protein